jgi:hypothetical protein
MLAIAVGARADEPAPLRVRFLKREPGQLPSPPKLHLRLELENPHAETRWLLTTFSKAIRLPDDGTFKTDPEAGFPFFGLKTAAQGTNVVLVGFLGEPRFSAFLLPARAKLTLDDFEVPTTEDVTEMDWAEASVLDVAGTRAGAEKDNFAQPFDRWIKAPLTCSAQGRLPAGIVWTDLFRDPESGELRPGVPKDAVTGVTAKLARRGRATVEGFQAAPTFYQVAEKLTGASSAPWRAALRFRPVKAFKAEHLDFAPDGSWLAVSLQGFKVFGLDLVKGGERLFPGTASTRARFFAFSPEGHLLVKQPTGDGLTEVADWTTGKAVELLRYATRSTLAGTDHVAAPGSQRIMVSFGRSLGLWDPAKFEIVAKLERPEEERPFTYRGGCFSGDGKRFAASYESDVEGGRTYVWELPADLKGEVVVKPLTRFDNRQAAAIYLAMSHDGKVLAGVGKQASAVTIGVVDARETVSLHEVGFRNFHALALSPDGKTVAVASTSFAAGLTPALLELRDTATGQSRLTLEGLTPPISALTFSPDGRRLAGGDASGNIQLWQRD